MQTFLYLCCAVLCMTASRPVCYWQVQHMFIWRKLISLSIQEISRQQVGQFCSQDLLVCYLGKKIIIFGLQIFLCSCIYLYSHPNYDVLCFLRNLPANACQGFNRVLWSQIAIVRCDWLFTKGEKLILFRYSFPLIYS